MRQRAVVVDVDGTVAIKGERSPYDLSRVDEDLPNAPIVTLVRELARSSTLIFVSGREDSSEEATRSWLEREVGEPFLLFMRRTGDVRKDSQIKREIFESQIRPEFNVWLVLDDRNQTVAMWRELGIVCCQVADGDF